jgi:hypothetical protein
MFGDNIISYIMLNGFYDKIKINVSNNKINTNNNVVNASNN